MMETALPYHHGDLRAALIRAALEAFEQGGSDGVSLRGLAETVGVSRSAPYSHFRSKRELMAAIAEVGFERFLAEMERVDESANARERFLAIGAGYLRFALENPGLFKLMFSAELATLKGVGDLESKSARAFEVFQQGLNAFLAQGGGVGTASPAMQTLAWSSVHGLAFLLLEKRLPVRAEQPMALTREVTSLFTDMAEAWLTSGRQ
jgi:AcrR family transcriptional regulator